jgi:hypothetical protein
MKYEMTEERNGRGLYRIRALRDIPLHGVKAGDLGGWVSCESNLAQEGDCWVGNAAQVFESAQVFGNAKVSGDAQVFGYARIFESARVRGEAQVSGDAWICDAVCVSGNAKIMDGICREY